MVLKVKHLHEITPVKKAPPTHVTKLTTVVTFNPPLKQ
jgi:hypothetical protein